MTDLVIIGGGPAGMSAAVAAYEKGIRDIVIIERDAKEFLRRNPFRRRRPTFLFRQESRQRGDPGEGVVGLAPAIPSTLPRHPHPAASPVVSVYTSASYER